MVNELHKHYSYNCLTDEQFNKLMEEYPLEVLEEGVKMDCECYEEGCSGFYLPSDKTSERRCVCGNRRCYLQYDEKYGFYVAVD